MSKAERGYIVFTGVDANGIAQTGLTALINDRNTTLVVPWEVAHKSEGNVPIDIKWRIKSEDGETYIVTVPVLVTYDSETGESTAAYTHGTYTVEKVGS